MPTPELMTWVPSQRRWTIRYMGKRYYISCRQLRVRPETKEASIQAANAWWREKQASIDLAYREGQQPATPAPLPGGDVGSAMIGSNADWRAALADLLSRLPAFGSAATPPAPTEDNAAAALNQTLGNLLAHLLAGQPLPDTLRDVLPPARAAAVERAVKEVRGEAPADPDRTVKALTDAWLLALKTQVSINAIAPGSFDRMRKLIAHFAAFLGESADVSCIDAERLEGFYNFCLSRIAEKKWSRAFSKQTFSVAKQWVDWLSQRGTIPLPTNFRRRWRFGPVAKQIEVWPVEDVRRAIDAATGKLKLCLLLMVNCGMTQTDVSDLLDSEVNWRDGRITRKRSKTRTHSDVPTVDYKLWPATFSLLKKHRSGQERVLLTQSGKPYMNRRLVDGKLKEYDGFGTLLRRLLKTLGINRHLKQLRKTAATMLESHETYGRYASYFLGHAPVSMADKHYVAPSRELFDRAILWLGERFGF